MTVTFQTNKLKSRRKAIIDGREYTVRQYGNIERLEILRMQDEVQKILSKYPDDAKDSDYSQEDLDKINANANKVTGTLVSLFDDGTKDQRHAKKLVATLSEEDVADIIISVFNQTEEPSGSAS